MKTIAVSLALLLPAATALADAASDATRADLVAFHDVNYQFDVPYSGTYSAAIDTICVSKPSGSLGAVLNPADFGAGWLPTPLSFTGQLRGANHIVWTIDQRIDRCLDVPLAGGGTQRVLVGAIHGQLEAVITDRTPAPVGTVCGQPRSNLATFVGVMDDSANQLAVDVNASCDIPTFITAGTVPLHRFAFVGTFSVAAPPLPPPPPPVHVTSVVLRPATLCQHLKGRAAVDVTGTVYLNRNAEAPGKTVTLVASQGLTLDGASLNVAAGQATANFPVHVAADFPGYGQVTAETDAWRTSGGLTMQFDPSPPAKECKGMDWSQLRKRFPQLKLPMPIPDPKRKKLIAVMDNVIRVQPLQNARIMVAPANAMLNKLQKPVLQKPVQQKP